MKKLLIVLAAVFAAGLIAAENTVCTAQKIKGWTYGQDRLDAAVYVEFFNQHNRHVLSFFQWKASGKNGPKLQCSLNIPGAYGNYSAPIGDFLNLVVNGIKLSEISLSPDDVKVWNDPKTGHAGAVFPLNFDGAQIILRAYIRPDSGVLFLNFQPDPKSVTPLKKTVIVIKNCISGLFLNGSRGIFDLTKYDRQAVSPVHTYTQKIRHNPLMPEDTYLLLMDTKLPGAGDVSKVRRDHGPSVFIPDPNVPTTVSFGIYTDLVMVPKPDFQEITVGVWQKKEVITNDYLTKFVKENPGQFRRE